MFFLVSQSCYRRSRGNRFDNFGLTAEFEKCRINNINKNKNLYLSWKRKSSKYMHAKLKFDQVKEMCFHGNRVVSGVKYLFLESKFACIKHPKI